MHCWNGNPYVSVHVDNVVPGEPAAEPHQPEAIDDAMGWEHLDSEAVAGERAEEPHQQGTRSEIMQGQWHRPGGSDPLQADYKRLGKVLLQILRCTHKGKWLTIDELVQILGPSQYADDVATVLATDRHRLLYQSRETAASGWVLYEYTARPKNQR